MKVEMQPHPRGYEGIKRSIDVVRRGAVEDRGDPKVREWAMQRLHDVGTPQDPVPKAQALLDAMRKHFSYVSDPVDLEFVASTRMTLCLDNAELCFRGGDCDDAARAMAALLLTVGLDAAIVHQEFAETDHVLAAVFDGSKWHKIDPCYFDKVGKSYPAPKETWTDVMTGQTLCSGYSCPPRGLPSPSVVLKARPLGEYVGVSGVPVASRMGLLAQAGAADAPSADVIASWGSWLYANDADMIDSIQRADAAIAQLTKIRKNLGLPKYDDPPNTGESENLTQGDVSDLWLEQMERYYEDVRYMSGFAHTYAQEALRGERDAVWYMSRPGDSGQLALVTKSSDMARLGLSDKGEPLIIWTANRSGNMGLAPLAVAAVVVVAAASQVAVAAAVYLAIKQICEVYVAKAQATAQQNLASRTTQLVQDGKATPEQAAELAKAIGGAAPIATATQLSEKHATWSENLLTFGKYALIGGGALGLVGLTVWALDRYGPETRKERLIRSREDLV